MYAIRSYYVLHGGGREGDHALRFRPLFGQARGDFRQGFGIFQLANIYGKIYILFQSCLQDVITSYSIHYTKLYEDQAAEDSQGGAAPAPMYQLEQHVAAQAHAGNQHHHPPDMTRVDGREGAHGLVGEDR